MSGIYILKQFAFCKMEDAPLRIVQSKENMEFKSEIGKCVNGCIREKQIKLLLCAAFFPFVSYIIAKGKQQKREPGQFKT